jgi:hypothetical protein
LNRFDLDQRCNAMTTIDDIEQLFAEYFSKFDGQVDESALITLFVGSANSPLAVSLLGAAKGLQLRQIELHVVFATSSVDHIAPYVEKLATDVGVGRYEIRVASARQFRSYNEQLVLGSTAYIAGPTIANAAAAGAIDTSTSKEEVAVATFAFDLLWKSSEPLAPVSGTLGSLQSYLAPLSGALIGMGDVVFRQLLLLRSNRPDEV